MSNNETNEVTKHAGGRPLKYNDPVEMQILIDKYFDDCDINDKPYTITGLALALDTNREALINYGKRDEFSHTIRKAKLRIQNYAECCLFNGKNPAGVIFNLKNNHGWVDKQEVVTTNTNVNTNGIDLSGMSIEELKSLIAATECKMIEADYTSDDE
jgi:hypothetical protein